MTSKSLTAWQREYINNWFDGLHPSYLAELEEEHGKGLTARKAWNLTFGEGAVPTPEKKPISTRTNLCHRLSPAPAHEGQCESVAAPAAAVQGQDTEPTLLDFQKFIAERCALADQDLLNLAPCLGDGTVFPTDIQVQLDYMRRLADCQAFIGLFLEFRAINFGGQESAHTPSVVPAGNTGTTVLQGGALA